MANIDKVYKFVGSGEGVPGLPHVISESEAKELSVWELLQAAIKNGNYSLIKEPSKGGSDKSQEE